MRTIEELLAGDIPRDQMTTEEERTFVNHWYERYEQAGFTKVYRTPYTEFAARVGMEFRVLGRLTEKDTDLECLPMWKIQFNDGFVICANPEEIALLEIQDQPADIYLRNPSYPCSAEELVEGTAMDFPCQFCCNASTTNGVTFACAKGMAAKMIADIGNGKHITVACDGDYEDLFSRYFKIAQKGELAVIAELILRVAAPGHNDAPYYEIHVIDNINDDNCTLDGIDAMTEQAVEAKLKECIDSASRNLTLAVTKEMATPTKYLVQCKDPDGNVTFGLYTEQQVINLYGFRDCSNCEYEVYDVHRFGHAVRLREYCDSHGEPNYHRFCYPKQLGGHIVISGFSPEH